VIDVTGAPIFLAGKHLPALCDDDDWSSLTRAKEEAPACWFARAGASLTEGLAELSATLSAHRLSEQRLIIAYEEAASAPAK
jgi:hypothetical protein